MIKNKTFLLWWRLKEGGQRSQWYSVLISWDDFVTNLQVKTCFNFLFRFLCAGILLPYPSDNLVLDVVLLLLFLGLETLRIFYGENPNRNTWEDRKQLTSDWSVTELHKSVLMRYNSYCTKNAAASVSKHGSCCHVTHKKKLVVTSLMTRDGVWLFRLEGELVWAFSGLLRLAFHPDPLCGAGCLLPAAADLCSAAGVPPQRRPALLLQPRVPAWTSLRVRILQVTWLSDACGRVSVC